MITRTNLTRLLAIILLLSGLYFTVTSKVIEIGEPIDWHEGVVK